MDLPAFRQRPISQRLAGASGTLLLQGGFLLLFLYSFPQFSRPIEAGKELIFVLRQPPRPPSEPTPSPPVAGPPAALPALAPPIQAPSAFNVPPAALPDLQGFGQALNDCAPERYAKLKPEEKARCPRPGEGVVRQDQEIDLSPPTHVRDLAHWQEQWDEKHWVAGLCDPGMGGVAVCQIRQAVAESERAADVNWHLARDKADRLKPLPPEVPKARPAPPR